MKPLCERVVQLIGLAVFDRIDLLEKTPMQVKRYIRYRESFQPFAWAALAFLLLPFVAGALRITAEP